MISDMETVVVCPACGHQNSPQTPLCANCRGRLARGTVVTEEEGFELERRRRAAAKRQRLVRWGLGVLIVLGVVAWIAYKNTGALPPPVSSISAVPMPGDWAMFQRDPAHAAFVSDEGAVLKGELKWRFMTDAPIFSSPAVVGGQVYLSTGDRRIVALDAEAGGLIWEYEVNSPVNSSPAVAGDLLFVGLRDGRVLALHKDTGEIQWEFRTGGPVYSSPAVHLGVLYVGSGDSRLYALDAMTGEERWSYLTGGWVTSDPAVNHDVVAVTSRDRYLYLIDIGTGERRLDYLASFTSGSPALHGNKVYAADKGGVLRAIDWRKRELPFEKAARWVRNHLFAWGVVDTVPPQKGFVWGFHQPTERFAGTPVVAGDKIYIGSDSGTLFALNRSTGEEVWTFRAESRLIASPSVVRQTVFVGDTDGLLYAVDALTGEVRWEFKTGGRISSTPVVANGVLYLASWDGTLYAID